MDRDNQEEKDFSEPREKQRNESADSEFSEEFIDAYEKEMELKSKEQRKGIQSIPFYRNG